MRPRLIAISDRQTASAEVMLARFEELARSARPGSVLFQLRDLDLPARARLALGTRIAALARSHAQLFVVNDRIDLAGLLGADGVHLGEAGIDTADARRLLGEEAFVSRACHDPSLVATLDSDAVLLSPILAPRKEQSALGLDGLRRACQGRSSAGSKSLLFALGGVSAGGVQACLDAGADGVAMVGALVDAAEIGPVVQALGIIR